MAWRCSGCTHAELISKLASARIIKSAAVKQALMSVDRAHFLPETERITAYLDAPQYLG